MFMKKIAVTSLVFGAVALMSACGGGGTSSPALVPVATTNLAIDANATVISAVGTAPVTFPNGFSGVDGSGAPVSISGATTVAFSGSGASPNVSITNGGFTASGATTFGSCIFTFNASNFPAASGFATGQSVKVNPCTLTVKTSGLVANGSPTSTTATLTFGSILSLVFSELVVINSNGSVSIGGFPLGTVTVVASTGAGS